MKVAKKSGHPAVLDDHAATAIRRICALFERARSECECLRLPRVFELGIRALEAAMRLAPDSEWKPLMVDLEPAGTTLAKILAELLVFAQSSYRDLLGPVYMHLDLGNAHTGQYFTPWEVSLCIARITVASASLAGYSREKPLTIHDPCVGSGGMLLAAAEALPAELVEASAVAFFGIDIDPLCVAMSRLNLRLHGLRGVIQQGNSLTMGGVKAG